MTKKPVVEQEWLAHEIAPSGIEIRYGVNPKRVYEVRKNAKARWKEVPSVTTVLGVLEKPALPWWGMRVGVQGVLSLFSIGLLKAVQHNGAGVLACMESVAQEGPLTEGVDDAGNTILFHAYAPPVEQLVVAGVPQIEDLLKRAKLTVNHVRDQAGDRGQSVHDAFELWAKEGHLPDPAMFPPTEAGYVQGLLKFIEESGAKAIASEVQVGSVKHGFAGRYDVRLEYPQDVEVVTHHTPVRGETRSPLARGVYLDDLKTSKAVYPSHFKQLAAYEEASVECGYEPTAGRGVIHVDAEGNYKRVPSYADFKDFKVVLGVYKSNEAMERRRKELK